MSSQTRSSASPRLLPAFLNPVPAQVGTDRPLREQEFTPLWEHYLPYVQRLVVDALRHVSLHRAEELASARGTSQHLLAGVGVVRQALLGDGALQEDLAQEVAIALLQTIRGTRGVAAAAPVVEAWLRGAVKWIVRGKVREPAMLRFAAGTPAPEQGQGMPDPGEAVTLTTPEEVLQRREAGAMLDALLAPRELAVVKAWKKGWEPAEIAIAFEATGQAIRCILCRAWKKLGIEVHPNRKGGRPRKSVADAKAKACPEHSDSQVVQLPATASTHWRGDEVS